MLEQIGGDAAATSSPAKGKGKGKRKGRKALDLKTPKV